MAENSWKKIRKQKNEDKARYRDVYDRQQLERGQIEEKQTMLVRGIVAGVLGLLVFGLVYFLAALAGPVMQIEGDFAARYAEKDYTKMQESDFRYVSTVSMNEDGSANIDNILRYVYFPQTGQIMANTKANWPEYVGFEYYNEETDETIVENPYISDDMTEEELAQVQLPEIRGRFVSNFEDYKLDYVTSVNDADNYGTIYEDKAIEFYILYPDGKEIPVSYSQIGDKEYMNSLGFDYRSNFGHYIFIRGDKAVTLDQGMFNNMMNKKDFRPYPMRIGIGFIFGILTFIILYFLMRKNLDAQNIMAETSDINQYQNDQHIALPEEIQRLYDVFPDVGAHSSVTFSSMISHEMLNNKGLKKVKLSRFAEKDMTDPETGETIYKGTLLRDADGNPLYDEVPIIDEKFSQALFDASSVINDKYARVVYNPSTIEYNVDNKNRDKLQGKVESTAFMDKLKHKLFKKPLPKVSKYNTVADVINDDWVLPEYEPQRPAGMYIVDTAPVNTMVLAITRAGKGQTIIEPTLDMWTRELNPNNMVVNDPKGELLVKNYVRATKRGFTIVQFNLINPMKTDIYNPLALAADAAREGNSTKCAMYVENIAEVFFPVDGADDPLWPNAANNAFKRAAYGLIDFYLEEEKEMRRIAAIKNINPKALELKIDEMWGKVTLYNCYQLFTQLSSKQMKSPSTLLSEQDMTQYSDAEVCRKMNEAIAQEPAWNGNKEADMLTVYFEATDMLPKNSMRTLVSNANNALKAMGGADKMMASVYGIAITAMSFFTDPTISTLTSGTLNQNVDLAGLSFPRRFGARFHKDYLKDKHYVGKQCVWQAYSDKEFKDSLGKDFSHVDMVDREGWCKCFFKGCFKDEVSYIKLIIKDVDSDMVIEDFYFKFTKNYQVSYDGKTFAKDPILGTKIVKNGFLIELKPTKDKDGNTVYKQAPSTFDREVIANIANVVAAKTEELYNMPDAPSDDEFKQIVDDEVKEKCHSATVQTNVFMSTFAKYQEKCKMVFLVTPPHLMKYAKLILILIKQLVDLNFDQSYMTKSNQKPLYKTRYMLDELGNLQSEGHGISGFETMLSIGLGQEQQFTLILQTLQQLKDVYGDSVDKIVQGNTSNIVFLKSTDDSMIETLSKISGTRHVTYTNSKSVTKDVAALSGFSKNEDKVSYTMSTVEEPVISCNDMLFIPPCNSMVFRAGDSPIWNRNATALPMSWRLFSNTIVNPGKEYTLQTVPSLSTAKDFDIRQNQPNFSKLFEKRLKQAAYAEQAVRAYKLAYGYDDDQYERIDVDVRADEIMEIISGLTQPNIDMTVREDNYDSQDSKELLNQIGTETREDFDTNEILEGTTENKELEVVMNSKDMQEYKEAQKPIYAKGTIARSDLYDKIAKQVTATANMRMAISSIYTRGRQHFAQDSKYFSVDANGDLRSVKGELYITKDSNDAELEAIKRGIDDANSRVFAENQSDADFAGDNCYNITPEFYEFLVSFNSDWPFTKGWFAEQMYSAMNDGNS